jgi:hypothetical protein
MVWFMCLNSLSRVLVSCRRVQILKVVLHSAVTTYLDDEDGCASGAI